MHTDCIVLCVQLYLFYIGILHNRLDMLENFVTISWKKTKLKLQEALFRNWKYSEKKATIFNKKVGL